MLGSIVITWLNFVSKEKTTLVDNFFLADTYLNIILISIDTNSALTFPSIFCWLSNNIASFLLGLSVFAFYLFPCLSVSGWLRLDAAVFYISQRWQLLGTASPLGKVQFDGLLQDCSNSNVLAVELLKSCNKPQKWCHLYFALKSIAFNAFSIISIYCPFVLCNCCISLWKWCQSYDVFFLNVP